MSGGKAIADVLGILSVLCGPLRLCGNVLVKAVTAEALRTAEDAEKKPGHYIIHALYRAFRKATRSARSWSVKMKLRWRS